MVDDKPVPSSGSHDDDAASIPQEAVTSSLSKESVDSAKDAASTPTPAGEDTVSPPKKTAAAATSPAKEPAASPEKEETSKAPSTPAESVTSPKPAPAPAPAAAKPSQTTPAKPATTTKPGATKKSYTVEDAQNEIAKAKSAMPACRSVIKDHLALKEKVDKLKSLLGRSAKAQRESKIELDATHKRLSHAMREVERLNNTLDKLQNRPTHMDLLMDFETNFDKALLSVGQTGGQDTAASPPITPAAEQESALDAMLMQELGEAKVRIDKLESLNATLMTRSSQLEANSKMLQKERDDAKATNSRLQMEAKMAQMEADHATRVMQEKAASLEEMQMEIDMVTKASAKAAMRAAKGEEAANTLKTDRQKVVQLEAQMQALKEWALASAESKRLMKERVKMLETKLRNTQGGSSVSASGDGLETSLFTKDGSLVIGAGDKGAYIVRLGALANNVNIRFVVLRWKFDFSPSDSIIEFNILKGNCKTPAEQKRAEYLIKGRSITGGAGGETEGAFNMDNACTLLWSNSKSWIRPRTVKYHIEVVAFK